MAITAYLAGPDVFLPNAVEHAQLKTEICQRYGIIGLSPLNQDVDSELPDAKKWTEIFVKDINMMERSDIVVANLTPFRGVSADSGTLVEIGWFAGQKRPIFAYSNFAETFHERSTSYLERNPDPVPGLAVEGFGLADNLMIPGVVLFSGGGRIVTPPNGVTQPFDALDTFESCIAMVASRLKAR